MLLIELIIEFLSTYNFMAIVGFTIAVGPTAFTIYRLYVRSVVSREIDLLLMPLENRILIILFKSIVTSILAGVFIIFFGVQLNFFFNITNIDKDTVAMFLGNIWWSFLLIILLRTGRLFYLRFKRKVHINVLTQKNKIYHVFFWITYIHLLSTLYFVGDFSNFLMEEAFNDKKLVTSEIAQLIVIPGYLMLVVYFLYTGIMWGLCLRTSKKKAKYKIKVNGLYYHVLYAKNKKQIVIGNKEFYEECDQIYIYNRETKEVEEFQRRIVD